LNFVAIDDRLQPLKQLFSATVLSGRMRLPSTPCAALSSHSIKPLIFCVTDFVLQ